MVITPLDKKDTYMRMLLIDFTLIPQHLKGKVRLLGLNICLCNSILDFLMA